MSSRKLGFGIIGTGSIASHHVKSIQEIEDCELVAVCSSTVERAKVASDKFGVPAYKNIDDFLAIETIDVVCVCTQSGRHMESIVAAALAGKHIICEKPLEVSLARAKQIINCCRTQGVKLSVIFQNRFNPDFLKLKEAVHKGWFGQLILGNAYIKWYRDKEYYSNSKWKGTIEQDGGAALINQGIHTIDLLLEIMQGVESVFGNVKTMVHDIEGEDIGVALLNFKNGAIGTVEGGTSLYPGYKERLEIYGENGSVIYEGGEIVEWNLKEGEVFVKNTSKMASSGASNPLSVDYRLHKTQILDMIDAIDKDREPHINGESAMKSLELISAIYESSRKKKLIHLK